MCICTQQQTRNQSTPKNRKPPARISIFQFFFSFVREKIHKKIPKNRKPPVRISIFRNFFPYEKKSAHTNRIIQNQRKK